MNVNEMTLEQVETRLAEIRGMDLEQVENPTEMLKEVENLQNALANFRKQAEAKKELRNKVLNNEVETIKVEKPTEENEMEERKVITNKSEEYRLAFYANLQGKATAEQRALLNIDGSTDASVQATNIALPHALDEKIWDNVHEAHPILADITTIHSGIVLDVNKITAVAPRATSKKDADATPELSVTIVPVTLAGKDYPVSIPASYAMDSMNPNGLEEMLAQFIADEIGEALAKDVFAQMKADATVARKVAKGADLFDDVRTALAMVKASKKVVYAGDEFYNLVGYRGTDGHAEDIEKVLKCEIKYDPACTDIVVADPSAFVLNEAVAMMIEKEKSVKDHKVYFGGYLRAEGTMRDTRKVAYIA